MVHFIGYIKAWISSFYFRKGIKFLEKEHYQDAILFFNTAGKYHDPLYFEGKVFDTSARGHCYYHLNEFENAEIDFINVLDNEPQNINALFGMYAIEKDPDKQIKYMEKVLIKEPQNFPAINNIGLAHSQKENYPEALKHLEQALAIEPKMAFAHNNIGFVYHKLGETEKGMTHINRSLELDPNNSYAYKNKAIILLDKGEKDEAIQLLIKANALGYENRYGQEVNELLNKLNP